MSKTAALRQARSESEIVKVSDFPAPYVLSTLDADRGAWIQSQPMDWFQALYERRQWIGERVRALTAE